MCNLWRHLRRVPAMAWWSTEPLYHRPQLRNINCPLWWNKSVMKVFPPPPRPHGAGGSWPGRWGATWSPPPSPRSCSAAAASSLSRYACIWWTGRSEQIFFRIVIKYFPGHYWHRRAHPQLQQRPLHRQGGGAEGELWLVETSITWSCDINTHLWLVQAPEADHFCNLTRTSVKISFPEMKRRVFVNFLGYKVTKHTTWNISSKQNYCQEPNLIHLQRCKGRCGDSVNSVACVPLRNGDTWFLQSCFDIYWYLRISIDIYT